MNKNDIKKEKENYGAYEKNKQDSSKIYKQVVELGYDYILEKLKKHGFSNPEKVAKKILDKKS